MVSAMEPSLDRPELLRRFYEREPLQDGVFVVGVLSTGIYCLPSCTARKPLPENVRFFADEGGAKRAGLRACKRCKPDRFYRGFDPDLEALERLAARVRSEPGEFHGPADLGAEAGWGATKRNELFRRAFHTTPATFLARARVEHAARSLRRRRVPVLEAGLAAGFESPSAFHERFRRAMGLAPGAYRDLGQGGAFVLELPRGFRPGALFSLFGRDPNGTSERVAGSSAAKAAVLGGRPARIELDFRGDEVRVRVRGRVTRAARYEAHAQVVRLLGLDRDPAPFERHVARRGHGRLVRGRRGLRIPRAAEPFEALLWVIVGQQVNLTFAALCRQRLIELAGTPAGDGFVAPPTPAQVARVDYGDLQRLQFSRRKAEYAVDLAGDVAEGRLPLDELGDGPFERLTERLLAARGLGPWSVAYLAMRAFGFEDCVPVGDAGLVSALRRWFDLPDRPDAKATLRAMEPFAPHRSLATYHLWQTLEDPA